MALAWHCCRCLLLAGLLVIVASSLGHTPTRTESVFYYQPANILGICNQLTVLFIAFLSFFFSFFFSFAGRDCQEAERYLCTSHSFPVPRGKAGGFKHWAGRYRFSVFADKTDSLALSVSWCLHCIFLRYSVRTPTSTPY